MTQRLPFIGAIGWLLLGAVALTHASEHRETALVKAVKRARPSVVDIHTEKSVREGQSVFDAGKGRRINGMGTGVVIDERGYIVTNYHVVADVELVRTTFDSGASYEARVVSFDRELDLALIKVESDRPLPVVNTGTSSDLMLGETVIAIGNAFGYNGTVTVGIISALGRNVEVNETQSYKNLIQTDASINPGNSGGPLLNLDGDVIGINVAIRAGAQRIGFAIPIDDARRTVARLMSTEQLQQTWHGLVGKDVKAGLQRQLLVDVAQAESPAALAGLQSGDVIVKVGPLAITDGVDLERAILGRKAGDLVEVTRRRADKVETVQLKLAALNPSRGVTIASSLPPAPAAVVTRANNDDAETERFWNVLGLRLAGTVNNGKPLAGTKYRGGLKVIDVRPESSAALNGISKGDLLVGLQEWETLSPDNVSWILNQPVAANELKFLVVRGQQTLYGHIQMASRQK